MRHIMDCNAGSGSEDGRDKLKSKQILRSRALARARTSPVGWYPHRGPPRVKSHTTKEKEGSEREMREREKERLREKGRINPADSLNVEAEKARSLETRVQSNGRYRV